MYARSTNPRVLQDYFEAISAPNPQERRRVWHLISSHAELLYRVKGGRRCPVCRDRKSVV